MGIEHRPGDAMPGVMRLSMDALMARAWSLRAMEYSAGGRPAGWTRVRMGRVYWSLPAGPGRDLTVAAAWTGYVRFTLSDGPAWWAWRRRWPGCTIAPMKPGEFVELDPAGDMTDAPDSWRSMHVDGHEVAAWLEDMARDAVVVLEARAGRACRRICSRGCRPGVCRRVQDIRTQDGP